MHSRYIQQNKLAPDLTKYQHLLLNRPKSNNLESSLQENGCRLDLPEYANDWLECSVVIVTLNYQFLQLQSDSFSAAVLTCRLI
jgi:hypothetical protein